MQVIKNIIVKLIQKIKNSHTKQVDKDLIYYIESKVSLIDSMMCEKRFHKYHKGYNDIINNVLKRESNDCNLSRNELIIEELLYYLIKIHIEQIDEYPEDLKYLLSFITLYIK